MLFPLKNFCVKCTFLVKEKKRDEVAPICCNDAVYKNFKWAQISIAFYEMHLQRRKCSCKTKCACAPHTAQPLSLIKFYSVIQHHHFLAFQVNHCALMMLNSPTCNDCTQVVRTTWARSCAAGWEGATIYRAVPGAVFRVSVNRCARRSIKNHHPPTTQPACPTLDRFMFVWRRVQRACPRPRRACELLVAPIVRSPSCGQWRIRRVLNSLRCTTERFSTILITAIFSKVIRY